MQASTKHYVDAQMATALPLSGGTLTGPMTAAKIGAAYQVDQFAGADFGAKLQACVNAMSATYGGTCDARNFTGSLSMGSSVTVSTANATVLLPCATISTANQIDRDRGNAQCVAARLRAARRQRGERKPGRNRLCLFRRRRDGPGGRSDICGRYTGIPSGQCGDQYHRATSAPRRDSSHTARRNSISRACIFWATRTRRA